MPPYCASMPRYQPPMSGYEAPTARYQPSMCGYDASTSGFRAPTTRHDSRTTLCAAPTTPHHKPMPRCQPQIHGHDASNCSRIRSTRSPGGPVSTDYRGSLPPGKCARWVVQSTPPDIELPPGLVDQPLPANRPRTQNRRRPCERPRPCRGVCWLLFRRSFQWRWRLGRLRELLRLARGRWLRHADE